MEKKLTLRDIPEEYFGNFRTKSEDKSGLWVGVLGTLPLLMLGLGLGGDAGGVGSIVSLTLLCLYLLQIIPAIFYSFEKNVRRFRKGYIICSVFSMEVLCLLISNFLYGGNAYYIDGLYNDVSGEEITYFAAALIFLQHIIMLFLFHTRIKKRIISGCYLPGGPGFWSKELLPKIGLVSVIMPMVFSIAAALSRGALFCSGSVTLTETNYPFVAFILFVLAEAVAVLFAYGNANLLAKYSYVKIHGCDEENVAEADAQENQVSAD